MSVQKQIAVLGSTGSIGTSALEVIGRLGQTYHLAGITGHVNWRLLAEQARKFRPDRIVITDESQLPPLQRAVADLDIGISAGPEACCELASSDGVDLVLAGIVGIAGLAPTLAAVEAGKTVAIANKESLVVAGELLTAGARQSGATILPVDSEHSAIFQAMHAGQISEVRRIILTASGGPFRGYDSARLANVTREQALDHPTWNMGPKITIDSASLMNKALEIVEAKHLFGLASEAIEVMVHPESIIHSMVEFVDGSMIAQMGTPDMRTPIQYALTYPARTNGLSNHLDLTKLGSMRFEPPDREVFPSLRLGERVAREGGSSGAVLNAANEEAVAGFLEGRIKFSQISELVEQTLDQHHIVQNSSLDELMAADAWARDQVKLTC